MKKLRILLSGIARAIESASILGAKAIVVHSISYKKDLKFLFLMRENKVGDVFVRFNAKPNVCAWFLYSNWLCYSEAWHC